jgi:hypothetical protein
MTGLQRRLIEASRSGDESDQCTCGLVEGARTVTAAARAPTVGCDARDAEARALRARACARRLMPF